MLAPMMSPTNPLRRYISLGPRLARLTREQLSGSALGKLGDEFEQHSFTKGPGGKWTGLGTEENFQNAVRLYFLYAGLSVLIAGSLLRGLTPDPGQSPLPRLPHLLSLNELDRSSIKPGSEVVGCPGYV